MRRASMMEREREERKRKAFTAETGKKRSALRKPLGGLDLVGWRSCSGARSRFVQVGGGGTLRAASCFSGCAPNLANNSPRFVAPRSGATFCTNSRPRRRKHLKRWFMKVCMVFTNIVKICNPHDRYGDPRYDCEKEWGGRRKEDGV